MVHLDLFSGIGGFALAADWVWDDVEHIFCDNDEFCAEVLKKHWPHSPIYGDIRTLTADSHWKRHLHGQPEKLPTEERKQALGQSLTGGTERRVDLLTGGFPCQPFSQAGRRRGTEDDRYLWPEMLRVIREFHPRWVIGENVGGLITWSDGLVLETVCADMEKEGYEVQPFVIPAVAVGAPHRRDRIWFVAHDTGERSGTWRSERKGQQRSTAPVISDSDAPDTTRKGRKQRGQGGGDNARIEEGILGRESWSQNWLEVATRLCRVDDGVPRRMDRNPRLKALGNAIVPQVAAEIFKAIKEIDI